MLLFSYFIIQKPFINRYATKINFKHYTIKSLIKPGEEQLLVENIRTDRNKFGILFDKYYNRIFGYILRRTLNYDLAGDIAAETFLKAFLKIDGFQWKDISISSWLFKIATNEIRIYYRKQKYSPRSLDQIIDSGEFDIANKESFEEEREKIEQELKNYNDFILVQKKLEKLSVKYQEVIALKYFEEKTIKEISGILGKKEGTIKSLISRGLQKLKDSF